MFCPSLFKVKETSWQKLSCNIVINETASLLVTDKVAPETKMKDPEKQKKVQRITRNVHEKTKGQIFNPVIFYRTDRLFPTGFDWSSIYNNSNIRNNMYYEGRAQSWNQHI